MSPSRGKRSIPDEMAEEAGCSGQAGLKVTVPIRPSPMKNSLTFGLPYPRSYRYAMEKLLSLTKRYRILLTRVLLGIIVLTIVISAPVWRPGPAVSAAIDILAFFLVLTATFGRLWALTFISGHKTKDLITEGPYSAMRNPLYFFSLLGALGIGILTKSILVVAAMVLAFALYYPMVIHAEEDRLERFHGERFRSYKARVPSFIPRFSAYVEPIEYPVNARCFRRALFSVMWFPLIYLFFLELRWLHAAGIVPVLVNIP